MGLVEDRRVSREGRRYTGDDVLGVGLAQCESPIERAYLEGLVSAVDGSDDSDFDRLSLLSPPVDIGELISADCSDSHECVVVLQATSGRRRVDFLIADCDARLIVECDGHDYHERTKEQASRDRSRDRELLRSGVPVVRFTGSELWADPRGCALESLDILGEIGSRISDRVVEAYECGQGMPKWADRTRTTKGG